MSRRAAARNNSRGDGRLGRRAGMRGVLLAACFGYLTQKYMKKLVLPWGPAVTVQEPSRHAEIIDVHNDLLQVQHGKTQKIYAENIKGPETVVFGNDGSMYVLTEDAELVRLQNFVETKGGVVVNATAVTVGDLGMGRPLGGRFTAKGDTLYVADAILGLTRIRGVKDPKSKVEIVTSSVLDNGVATPILYANDVAIGPKTGRVYFTDSTDIAPYRELSKRTWDTLYASKLDFVRGLGKGRLLQYDPATDTTTVLARGIKFANGIAVNKDETYVVLAETFGVNLLKYNLQDGTLEVLVHSQDLPGYLDGVDCSWTTGMCYAVMPSAIVPIHKLWNRLPPKMSQLLRTVLMTLPRSMAPAVKSFGAVIEVNPVTKQFRFLLDPSGKDIHMLAGVTVHENKLYLGSLENKFIGVYSL